MCAHVYEISLTSCLLRLQAQNKPAQLLPCTLNFMHILFLPITTGFEDGILFRDLLSISSSNFKPS